MISSLHTILHTILHPSVLYYILYYIILYTILHALPNILAILCSVLYCIHDHGQDGDDDHDVVYMYTSYLCPQLSMYTCTSYLSTIAIYVLYIKALLHLEQSRAVLCAFHLHQVLKGHYSTQSSQGQYYVHSTCTEHSWVLS